MPDLNPAAPVGSESGQFSWLPILSAVESYGGTIIDLDRQESVGPSAFASTWRELARELGELGLERGHRVVMAVGNGPLFPAALGAILSLGASPLIVHAETPAAELKRLAARVGAGAVIGDDLDASSLADQRIDSQTLRSVCWAPTQWARLKASDVTITRLPLEGVPLHPTSGTTGQPKISVRPGPCAMEEARHYVETLDITDADTLLTVAPMSHAYAYGMGTMVPLLTGASIVTMRRFDPQRVADALGEHRITILPAVPAMLELLLVQDHWPAPIPRCVLSAGSPLPERIAREFRKRTGRPVRPLYGSTESGGIAIADGQQAGDCVGPPMEGVQVEIRTDAGSHWGADVGKVTIRSSSMMAGYLENETIDTSSVVDGWFSPGDLGRVDASGAIHLKGRVASVINVSGLKVLPSEVEDVLAVLPGVKEVMVYSGQRGNGEQFVKAAVAAPQLDVAEIRAYCEQQLVYYKRPEIINLVSSLPRTPTGKIIRNRLP